MKKLFTLALLMAVCVYSFASQNRKVLIIGIDGTRSDALQAANTPNIDQLIATGMNTWDSWHLGITVSGPSWSDIMCGVWENKHGVTNNSYSGSHYDQYPYFITHAKEVKPSLYCVQVVEWAPMSDQVTNDGWDLKLKVPDGVGYPTVSAAQTQLANPNLDAMFVYFDKVDLTGHASGFSPSNPAYINAIQFVDSCVGQVISALHARPNYATEEWLVLLVTDHGGIGTGHGGNSNQERNIWWIGSGNVVNHGEIHATDPGSYQMPTNPVDTAKLRVTPVQTDIAVTALHHLIYDSGIRPENQTAWHLDGKSWLNSFTGIDKTNTTNNSITLFPNPTTDILTCWLNNTKHEAVNYEVLDMAGNVVLAGNDQVNDFKINVDVKSLIAGNYVVRLKQGAEVFSHTFQKQ